jgi:NAD(P)-dependent dehydrogenase (short-subunit alcohol dehydrogenase family)
MANVLITGANRGIGLEFARQFASRGDRVFAAVRSIEKAEELRQLQAKVSLVRLDVGDAASIRAAGAQISQQIDSLDLLINNAAIHPNFGEERVGQLDMQTGVDVMRVNAVGQVIVAQEFLPLLKKSGGKIVSITSGWGSVSGNEGSFPYWYAGSKAALNMMMRSVAGDVAGHGIVCVVVSPGWVKTDMGTDAAPLTTEQSVSGMMKLIDGLNKNDNGKFYDHNGSEVPW